MQLTRPRLWRLGALLVLVGLVLAGPARADLSSGTWTGALEARGNYYWETSTRVVAPAFDVSLESPRGLRLHADYLVDSITSASQAAGAIVDVRFTETRHDVGGGLGYELDLGDQQLTFDLGTRYSTEPDYTSLGASLSTVLSLRQRTTDLRLGLAFVKDDVGKMLRGAERVGPDGRDLSDRGEVGELRSFVASLGVDQVLSPIATVQVGYDVGYMWGFLQNAYRQIAINGVLRDELHPDERVRHTVHGRLALYSRPTHTAVHLMYRAYLDTWDIGAISPEVRIYQELGPFAQLRLRHRYYTQTRAFFYRDPQDYTIDDELFTADPKMGAFHSNLLGAQLTLELEFLEDTALGFLDEATLDLGFDYIWNTNRYGDGVISQVGLRVPF